MTVVVDENAVHSFLVPWLYGGYAVWPSRQDTTVGEAGDCVSKTSMFMYGRSLVCREHRSFSFR